MNDTTLRQNVLDELQYEPSIDANEIGVSVENGIVTLTGHLPSYAQKLAAERAVAAVKGVKGYAEEIEVRLPLHQPGTSDDQIAKRAVDSLHWSTVVPQDKVQVKVEKGWVTLTGKVQWEYQRLGAANAVRNLLGVKGLRNIIELEERVSSKDVKRRIEHALKRRAEVDADRIQVEVAGNTVTLTGSVNAWSERRIAEEAAWSSPGVVRVSDRLTVG